MMQWNQDLWLLTQAEFDQLPNGTELVCINGNTVVKGQDRIDTDTRAEHLAHGVRDPENHPLRDLFLIFMLK
jgi:hypothetical protein